MGYTKTSMTYNYRVAYLTVAISLGAILLVLSPRQHVLVVLPILSVMAVSIFFLWVLRERDGGIIPVFEIGTVYVAVVSVYMLYPLISYVGNGLEFATYNDNRLWGGQTTSKEVGTIAWYHAVHLISFVTVYLVARGRSARQQVRFAVPDRSALLIVGVLYLMIMGFFLFLNLFFDLSKTTYAETYLLHRRLPLVLAQLSGHLGSIKFTLELVILAALFCNYRKYRLLIAVWLLVLALTTFARLESRADLILFIMAAALMYHYLVRPIPFRLAAIGGVTSLALFAFLGALRSSYGSEFDTLFANAFDLRRLKAMGAVGNLPLTFYFSDLIALVPQQFLPIAKISPSLWYVNTFYPSYAAAGGGFAFGTISESVVGGGWLDLIARGGGLGLLLAYVHRYFVRHSSSLWAFIFYVWTTVLVYQLFRNTTFSLLVLFVYDFLPVMVCVTVLSAFARDSVNSYWPSLAEPV